MKIIPAIDILQGQCVRLTQGKYHTAKVYNQDPLEVAKAFEDHGIKHLHLVDLDGARSSHIVNHAVLENIATSTDLKIDFGGGLKQSEDVRIAFECGAAQVTAGSVAAQDPDQFMQWVSVYGKEKIILGADCDSRKVATNGWLTSTALDILDFIEAYVSKGVQNVICTDISRDGTLRGSAIPLYREILESCNVQLIASGGVAGAEDLLGLREVGCAGAIIGKAFYEGNISLKELQSLC